MYSGPKPSPKLSPPPAGLNLNENKGILKLLTMNVSQDFQFN